ncbi:MAG: ribosome maturation factor RimM, partial [Actinomycetota bacterium]|nr:ribosome maturation factor RimM [Actinomycetota bacterium]
PHGRRGTIRVRAAGSGRHLREGIEPYVAGRRRRISRVRWTPKGFLVDLEDVGHRFEADGLRGEGLVLDRRELDAPEEDEFYVDDLVGLTAVGEGGEVLGKVSETFETPAHEVLVVRESEDAPVFYVPFTHEHVPHVDLAQRRVTVRPPEE